jgi:CspA family cold shock protein
MASGKVKWFDNKKGFGFIAQDTGQDVFVHHTSIMGNGFKTLNEGEPVTFDVVTSDKGLKASNVQRASA